MKPIIGITTNYIDNDLGGLASAIGARNQDYFLISGDYIRAVQRAGGIPVIIPVCGDVASVKAMCRRLDGIVFSGGNDIAPKHYGELNHLKLGHMDPERDRVEKALAKFVVEETVMPIMGICRGLQMINVALGGTLYQDLPSQRPEAQLHSCSNFPKAEAAHEVIIDRETTIGRLFGVMSLGVNSLHHQAIKALAPSLTPTMVAEDGIIEGYESAERADLFGLQWHPEMMAPRDPFYLKPFEHLVARAKRD